MRLKTGAILRDTRPETIITSACRGLARNTSDPKRARSFRDEVAFIISIAQHANPNVAGHSEDLRAQLISESSRVVNTSGKASAITFSRPISTTSLRGGPPLLNLSCFQIGQSSCFGFRFSSCSLAPVECALLDDVDVTDKQQTYEDHHLQVCKRTHCRALCRECLVHSRPGHEKNHCDVEQDEDHCDQVELHRETLSRGADRVLTTLVRHQLRSCSLTLSDELGEENVAHGEACRDDEHQQNGQVIVKTKRHLKHTLTGRRLFRIRNKRLRQCYSIH